MRGRVEEVPTRSTTFRQTTRANDVVETNRGLRCGAEPVRGGRGLRAAAVPDPGRPLDCARRVSARQGGHRGLNPASRCGNVNAWALGKVRRDVEDAGVSAAQCYPPRRRPITKGEGGCALHWQRRCCRTK